MERYTQLLREYILEKSPLMTRGAQGILRHPYVVPSAPDSPFYSATLWDWDSWLTGIVLGQVELELNQPGRFFEYESGTIINFLEHMDEDGFMPMCMTAEDDSNITRMAMTGGKGKDDINMHKPTLAQHAASIVQRSGEVDWVRPHMGGFEKFLGRYIEAQVHPQTGIAFWQDDLAVGVDNDPSVYYRPDKSCGSIYLNCLLYREMLAYGYLLEMCGDVRSSIRWRGRAQDLADAVNEHCWDERDGTYYSVDFALRPVDPNARLHSGAPRDYHCLIMRIDNWSSFLPMWAGIATAERAERMVKRVRDARTFNARFGVRTLSRLEKMYDLRASNNPSNWRGPIWGISNFMVFDGLVKYGFDEDARELAGKTIALFGRDLQVNGSLHEYYHPDTGHPVVTHGFQNWDFLALNMMAWVEGKNYVTTY